MPLIFAVIEFAKIVQKLDGISFKQNNLYIGRVTYKEETKKYKDSCPKEFKCQYKQVQKRKTNYRLPLLYTNTLVIQ